jgi:hypothetical protein
VPDVGAPDERQGKQGEREKQPPDASSGRGHGRRQGRIIMVALCC